MRLNPADCLPVSKPFSSYSSGDSESTTTRTSHSIESPYSQSSRRRNGSALKAQGHPGSVNSVMRTSAMERLVWQGRDRGYHRDLSGEVAEWLKALAC